MGGVPRRLGGWGGGGGVALVDQDIRYEFIQSCIDVVIDPFTFFRSYILMDRQTFSLSYYAAVWAVTLTVSDFVFVAYKSLNLQS